MRDARGGVLLRLARSAIAEHLGLEDGFRADAPWLAERGATFVTLTLGGELRGCIGTLVPHRSVGEDVRANAVLAAFRDPRFPPLTRSELDLVRIEVSLLSPLEPMVFEDEADALAQLRPGVDGVCLEVGHHRGFFLPQVWEGMASRREFLNHLKLKAGLPTHYWSPDVRLERCTVAEWKEEGYEHARS